MKIKDIMKQPIYCCGPNTNLQVIGKMMCEHDCGAILIVDDDKQAIGIVTDRDIVTVASSTRLRLWDILCSAVINDQEVYTCDLDDELITALKKMEQHKIRRMPVVNNSGQAKGIITNDDLVHLAQERDASLFHQTIDTLRAVSKHH